MDRPTGILTLLFTDIEGSTRMVQRLGAEFDGVLDTHNRLMRTAIRSSGGIDVKTEGDSFFAVFETALSAVAAMVAAQRALDAEDWPDGGRVQVRMGSHTGEVRLGGDDYVGVEVNRAARLSGLAHGGQMVVSHTTRELIHGGLPPDLQLADLGSFRLKDFDETEQLYQVLAPDLPADFPPLGSREVPNNLPAQTLEFVGRDAEVAAIKALIADNRLVTLTGVGGSGKTRLSISVAGEVLGRFDGGVYFVGLDAISDPAGFDQAVAEAIGAPNVSDLVAFLVGLGEALLVVDNFEHILTASTRLGEYLEAAPRLRVLATSQALLRLRGEQAFPVPELTLPAAADVASVSGSDSGSLFMKRVWATDPSFEITEQNSGVVEAIVRRLDGLPLAIELAAARVRLFGLEGLRTELEGTIGTLGGGYANAPDRHKTLAAAVDWSYRLLGPGEQVTLRRAAVLVDGFSLEAGRAVCGEGAIDSLSALLDKSLIRSSIEGGNARFSMLETIRSFGLEQLDREGEIDTVHRAHADYFTNLAVESAPHLLGRDTYGVIERLSIERANLTAALRWSAENNPDPGLRAMAVLCRFYELSGSLTEGQELGEALVAAPGSTPAGRLDGLLGLAHIEYWLTELARAQELYEEAVTIAEELGDEDRLADALLGLAYTYTWLGKKIEAAPLMERAEAAYATAGNGRGVRLVQTGRATDLWIDGKVAAGLEIFAAVLVACREAGDVSEEVVMELIIAAGPLYYGELDVAIRGILHTLHRATEMGDDGRTIMALDYMGRALSRVDPATGARLGGALQKLVDQQGGTVADLDSLGLGNVHQITTAALAPDEHDRLWADGARLDLPATVALVREWAESNGYCAAAVPDRSVTELIEAHRGE